MNKLDKQIIRSAKRLAQKECSNYADGSCLPEGCTCYAVNPAYVTIHDGAIGCDYFLKAVQPTAPELSTAVWHEIFREEEAAGEGWKACVRCHKPFLPVITSVTAPSAGQQQNRPEEGKNSTATGQGRTYPRSVTF